MRELAAGPVGVDEEMDRVSGLRGVRWLTLGCDRFSQVPAGRRTRLGRTNFIRGGARITAISRSVMPASTFEKTLSITASSALPFRMKVFSSSDLIALIGRRHPSHSVTAPPETTHAKPPPRMPKAAACQAGRSSHPRLAPSPWRRAILVLIRVGKRRTFAAVRIVPIPYVFSSVL